MLLINYEVDEHKYCDCVDINVENVYDKIVELFVDDFVVKNWACSNNIDVKYDIKKRLLCITDLSTNNNMLVKILDVKEI